MLTLIGRDIIYVASDLGLHCLLMTCSREPVKQAPSKKGQKLIAYGRCLLNTGQCSLKILLPERNFDLLRHPQGNKSGFQDY